MRTGYALFELPADVRGQLKRRAANLRGKKDRAKFPWLSDISQEGLEEMMVKLYLDQGGMCPGCSRDLDMRPGPSSTAAHLDHDHAREQEGWICIRGWLCPGCNRVLSEHATPSVLSNLIQYLGVTQSDEAPWWI